MSTPLDRSSTPVQNPYMDPSLVESDADRSYSQTTLLQTSQKLVGSNEAVIAQREREINDIAKGIIELSDIFRELQTMIIDQGTMLDRIDYNVERMGTDVKSADKELVVVCFLISGTSKKKKAKRFRVLLYQLLTTEPHFTGKWLSAPDHKAQDPPPSPHPSRRNDRHPPRETETQLQLQLHFHPVFRTTCVRRSTAAAATTRTATAA